MLNFTSSKINWFSWIFIPKKIAHLQTIGHLRPQDTKSLKSNSDIMSDLKAIATQIRRDIVRMVHGSASGHPGGSLGCTEYFTRPVFQGDAA